MSALFGRNVGRGALTDKASIRKDQFGTNPNRLDETQSTLADLNYVVTSPALVNLRKALGILPFRRVIKCADKKPDSSSEDKED